MNKDITLIILAAGKSTRFRNNEFCIKKQWIRIQNKPAWLFVADSLQNRYKFLDVIIAGSAEECEYMKKFCDYKIICGGESRQDSLTNALKYVKSEFIAVSDAARCNLDFNALDRIFQYKREKIDCIIPVINCADTAFLEDKHKIYLKREQLKLVQTPQISRVSVLKNAMKLGDFSDESSAINALGGRIACVEGSSILNKITHFSDLANALNAESSQQNNDFKIGYGFDVHKFCKGDFITLGGVKIKSTFGVKAHSDGDVALHALCDALLGAAGAGDIGEWFPPNDKQYKNADSKQLLKIIADFIYGVGFKIINADLMILAQIPKIMPHKNEMTIIISEILGIPKHCVNIKATTSEKLGYIGRSEGISASASVLIKLL